MARVPIERNMMTKGKKKAGKLAPLRGNVTPTNKSNVPQPVYGHSYTPGKAPSTRKAKHK